MKKLSRKQSEIDVKQALIHRSGRSSANKKQQGDINSSSWKGVHGLDESDH
ncbi:MAG: hypothetical protein RPU13_11915 [Candidatus Sedimenticola sp. (ex Thyasira tokunagai)]